MGSWVATRYLKCERELAMALGTLGLWEECDGMHE